MSETKSIIITPEQYRAHQRPVVELLTQQELFDFQVETLFGKGLVKYKDADPFRNRLPETGFFLFVPPKPQAFDLKHLMELVEVDGEKGENCLDADYLKDVIGVPQGAYLMNDVEDGAQRLDTKPSVSEKQIVTKGRSPFIIYEGIILAVVFPVLQHHNLDLLGSRYKSVHVPLLNLLDGLPKLVAYWYDDALPLWGAPSCGSRIVP